MRKTYVLLSPKKDKPVANTCVIETMWCWKSLRHQFAGRVFCIVQDWQSDVVNTKLGGSMACLTITEEETTFSTERNC